MRCIDSPCRSYYIFISLLINMKISKQLLQYLKKQHQYNTTKKTEKKVAIYGSRYSRMDQVKFVEDSF